MTLVWKTETGSLLQTQVGLADVVTTLSAAHAIYGWLGGLDGAKFLLSKISNSFSKNIKELELEKSLRLLPVTAHVLTSGGPLICSISNTADAFGGDARTQLIGLTICALAHELDDQSALKLFLQCLAPTLFDGADIAIDALRSQLNDASHLQRIINEGASRGLTNLFTNAMNGLNISFGDREWLRQNLTSKDDMEPLPSEIQMVGGLLKWILREDKEAYYTRSGLVARVAAYMKAVGYTIGRIQAWDGIGNPPISLGSKAVLLVMGGSSSTDPLMLNPQEMVQLGRTHHYQYKTVGAMLMDALDNVSRSFPEVFQNYFETTFAYMKAHLNIQYVVNVESKVTAKLDWKPLAKGSTSIGMRLASIYYPRSAEYIAPCYSSIASSECLDQILKNKSAIASFDEIPEALAHFRVLSAAIVISITARLADGSFEDVSHSTLLELSNEDVWLEPMCKVLDGAYESGLGLHKAVSALAAVHAAHQPELIENCDSRVLAWRRGVYAVVPSILLNMNPTREAIGFRCLDRFWANVTVREDGSIRSAQTSASLQDLDMMEDVVAKGSHLSALQSLNNPWLGPPSPSTPDVPLYLSLERPLHHSAPDLCFVGRIGGSVVGAVGIDSVLSILLRSLNENSNCLGHTSAPTVVNVKASSWAASKYLKPASEELITFIPVSGDPSWALFLAGETAYFKGRIVFKCVECAANQAGSHGVLIGYL